MAEFSLGSTVLPEAYASFSFKKYKKINEDNKIEGLNKPSSSLGLVYAEKRQQEKGEFRAGTPGESIIICLPRAPWYLA